MSVRLEVTRSIPAGIQRVWDVVVDWRGQYRWVPMTQVRATTAAEVGLGVRVEALSGWWLGGLPFGLLDRFIVTGWSPPAGGRAELEILHLGPYFTGEGVFTLTGDDTSTTMTCVELINAPGGSILDPALRLALPVMRAGFGYSLRKLANVVQS